MRLKKSQSIFDFALALIAVSGLIVGIVRIWIWFNANYAKRQQAYQAGRLYAAGPNRPSDYSAPIQIGGNETCPSCSYEPLSLSPDWVFRGVPTGTVSGVPVGSAFTGPGSACDTQCTSQCTGQVGCQDSSGEFRPSCDCYQNCSSKCYCANHIQNTVKAYATQVTSICGPDNNCDQDSDDCDKGQACTLRKTADDMRDTADDCDDPWELCWWGDWGKTPRELRKAAQELDDNAAFLESTAKKLVQRSNDLQACCAEATKAEQELCLDNVSLETSCDASCSQEAQSKYSKCADDCSRASCVSRCKSAADAYSTACYSPCLESNSLPCAERVANIVELLQAQIDSAQESKAELQDTVDGITTAVSSCSSSADATCALKCRVYDASGIYYSIDTACVATCKASADYNNERNACCQQYSGWGRDCDTPTTNCDQGSGSQKCGLSKIASDANTELQDIIAEINKWQAAISTLANCCSLGSVEEQNDCMSSKIS